MPWDVTQRKFIRNNGQFRGQDVWDQDAIAGVKIRSDRHDKHDQDLADGINACLNRQGLNAMEADIKMGGHKVTDVARGTEDTDAANVGQIVSRMTFSNDTRTLTLVRNASPNLTVVIPDQVGGGGGGGSVTSISAGAGLVTGDGGPITDAGVISMETVGISPGRYVLPTITVDEYGRVTQVEPGALPDSTNLGIANHNQESLDIVDSGSGTSARIPAVNDAQAGLVPVSLFQQIKQLAANALQVRTGTWKPGGNPQGMTIVDGGCNGIWRRIGDLVYVAGRLEWSSRLNDVSVPFTLTRLPFRVADAGAWFTGQHGTLLHGFDDWFKGTILPQKGVSGPWAGEHTPGYSAEHFGPFLEFNRGEKRATITVYEPTNSGTGHGDARNDYNLASLSNKGAFTFAGWYITSDS